MSVVGIDFGDESLTVAVARRAGIDVLQNEIGKRKTRSLVSFGSTQRFITDEATSQYLSNAANSVVYIKRIIGKMFSDPEIAHEQKFIPAKLVPDAQGRVALQVKHLGKEVLIPPEQVVSTFLLKMKEVCAINMDGQKITDCVIAIPHYFTDAQRRAMLDAARMLQTSSMGPLNVLRLVNDITAVAIQYGVRRTFAPNETRLVLFYDIGVSSTDVALASISAAGLKMEAMTADRSLGGRDFDELLVTKLAADIKDKYKLDVLSNTKALLKLRKECDRVKQTLSANSTVPYNIEYIMDNTDVSGVVTREQFEALIEEHLKTRLVAPIDRVLAAANVKIADLHSIEMLGGATRIPYIQTLVKTHTGRDLSKTCDADESVCWGATLHCATYSPSFKVKEYDVKDIISYPIKVEWQHDADAAVTGALADMPMEESINVFPANNTIPSTKVVTIKNTKLPLQVAARYSDPENCPSGNSLIARFAITAPTDPAMKAKLNESNKLKVKVKVDSNGLLSVISAQALVESEIEVEEPAPVAEKPAEAEAEKPKEEEKPAADGEKAADADKPKEGEAADAEKPKDDAAESEKAKAAEAEAAEKAAKAAEPAMIKVKKTIVEKVDLAIHSHYPWNLSQTDFRTAVEQELEFAGVDREVRETAEAMNSLEGYILSMKSRVQDASDLKPYFADEKANEFYETLKKEEEWLEDEGYDEKKAVYVARLESLKAITEPLVQRQAENQGRPEAVERLTTVLNACRELSKTTEERYSHIEAKAREEIVAKCDEVALWVSNKTKEQDARSLSEAPIVSIHDFDVKARDVQSYTNVRMNKAKPAPVKKEEPKKAEPAPAAASADKKAEEEPKTESAEKAEAKPMDDSDSAEPKAEAEAEAEKPAEADADAKKEEAAAEPKAEAEAAAAKPAAEEAAKEEKPMSDE